MTLTWDRGALAPWLLKTSWQGQAGGQATLWMKATNEWSPSSQGYPLLRLSLGF